ncbi:hypothetical protein EJ110_NYTH27930 [Nymphaea thermarum]|nr:hypothetical protein EJ110_NYTH27930 [Nymphaea thermarum]
MDIFLSTYEDGVCVRREWLVRKANWDQGSNWILTDVGSHPNCDIVISHPSVMYQHFVIDIAKDTLDIIMAREQGANDKNGVGQSSDDSKTSSQPESEESSSDEEESCGRNAYSPSPTTIEELAQRMLERVDQMIGANKSRRSIFSDWGTSRLPALEVITSEQGILQTPSPVLPAVRTSIPSMNKKGILGSASQYFAQSIPGENSTRLKKGMPEMTESFPPPRRTGIAKEYRQFYSMKPPMKSVPSDTQTEPVREMKSTPQATDKRSRFFPSIGTVPLVKDSRGSYKGLLPLPEQTSEPWTEQEIYEEIERLCHSSEGHIDVEPNESFTSESCEPTLDILTSKNQPKEGGRGRTLIKAHRSRAKAELQRRATQELVGPNFNTLIALNKRNSNKPGFKQRMKPLTIPELLEEEILATFDGILLESEKEDMGSLGNHQCENRVYPGNQNGEQQGKVDLDTLNVQTEVYEFLRYHAATSTSSQGKSCPKEGGHHKFQRTTLGQYIEKLYPERWRAYQFPDSPNCSRELRDSYSTLRTHVQSPKGTSAAGAQWATNKNTESIGHTMVQRAPLKGKEL